MYGLIEQDIKAILEVLKKHPGIKQVVIFGSRAMGNYKIGSDVDLAIKGKLSIETIATISLELNERTPLPYKFDVLSYESLDNEDLKNHIDQHGKIFASFESKFKD